MTQVLSQRLTHSYVGEFDHLDKWVDIGTIEEIGRRELPLTDQEKEDITEPRAYEVFVLVRHDPKCNLHEVWVNDLDPSLDYDAWIKRRIQGALHDTYSKVGCAHDYDCCGCRSYYARDAERVTGDLWKVTVSSSRNY